MSQTIEQKRRYNRERMRRIRKGTWPGSANLSDGHGCTGPNVPGVSRERVKQPSMVVAPKKPVAARPVGSIAASRPVVGVRPVSSAPVDSRPVVGPGMGVARPSRPVATVAPPKPVVPTEEKPSALERVMNRYFDLAMANGHQQTTNTNKPILLTLQQVKSLFQRNGISLYADARYRYFTHGNKILVDQGNGELLTVTQLRFATQKRG